MDFNADIDIDVKSHTKKENYGIKAIRYDPEMKNIQNHPSGIYVDTNMPIDKITNNAAIDYKNAEELGFIKIDILTNTYYDCFNSKQEILDAMNQEPNWDLLNDEKFITILPQINKQVELVKLLSPRSIEDLADCIALLRPGKQHLIQRYINDKQEIRKHLYKRPPTGMYFKKSHAIAYAIQIVCLMNKNDYLNFFK